MGSSLPKALDWFCAQIAGLAALSGVEIVQGAPGPEMPRESVLVGPVVDIEDDWSNFGCLSRREHWTAQVFVTVARPGDVTAEARDRAFEIVDAISDELKRQASTVQMNGQLLWSSFHRTNYAVFVGDDGVAAQIHCRLEGHANY